MSISIYQEICFVLFLDDVDPFFLFWFGSGDWVSREMKKVCSRDDAVTRQIIPSTVFIAWVRFDVMVYSTSSTRYTKTKTLLHYFWVTFL